MLADLQVSENESLEDALRAPKNNVFARRFLGTLPETVQAALLDAEGRLNRDGVHRMAMAIFVSAFQGDSGLKLSEKAFESIDMDIRNVVNAISRSLGVLAKAEALTHSGDRQSDLSIGADLAQTVVVYSAIKHNPALTVEKYLDQAAMFGRELTVFQEGILKVINQHRRSPKKLGNILTAYAQGVINSPPPAQAALLPDAEVSKDDLWEKAVKTGEVEEAPALFQNWCYNSKVEMKQPDTAALLSNYCFRRGEDMHNNKEGEFQQVDSLLAEIASQICTSGACFARGDKKAKLPICSPAQKEAREHCILAVKERNIEAGCKPEGTGSKKCPSAFAVCTASIGCRLGREKEK